MIPHPLTVIKGMAEQIRGEDKIKTLIRRNSDRLPEHGQPTARTSPPGKQQPFTINCVGTSFPSPIPDRIPSHSWLTINTSTSPFAKEESLVMDYDETKATHSSTCCLTPSSSPLNTAGQGNRRSGVMDNYQPFLELAVSDTGWALRKEHLPIFDRFIAFPALQRRGEPRWGYQQGMSGKASGTFRGGSRGTELKGTGITLPVKELVQLLEGDIKVNSEAKAQPFYGSIADQE